MKFRQFALLSIVAAMALASCNADKAVKGTSLKTAEDSLSYAFGVYNYSQIEGEGIEMNAIAMAKGMIEAKENRSSMNPMEAQTYIMSYFEEMEKKQMEGRNKEIEEMYSEIKTENEKFLEENAKREGVITTATGLQYEVLQMGDGPRPKVESSVRVHYRGTVISGEQFDSSYDRGEPAEFPLMGVIPGWTEVLQLMPVGSKFRVFIPQELAYGSQQRSQVILPYSTLIFDIELLAITD